VRRFLLGFLLGAISIFAVLVGLGHWLDVADPLAKADAIVAISGDTGARAETAIALWKQGYAPVLIFSGGIDPATPPRHGEQVAATLPNARHFVAPQIGHGVSLHGCAPRLIESFVRAASSKGLDGKCLERIPRPLFLLPLGTQLK